MLRPRPDVSERMLRELLETRVPQPFAIYVSARELAYLAGPAELATHLAALRAQPDGGWVVVRDVPPDQVVDYQRVKAFVGRWLTTPRTLVSALHEVAAEIVALIYVDAAPRGFEVMAADAVYGTREVFRAGDVFVRVAGRTQRWTGAEATRIVDRVVERHLRAAGADVPAAKPAAKAAAEPAAKAAAKAKPAKPGKPAKPAVPPETAAALVEAATDVVSAYAAGALAVRLRAWDVVRAAAAAQGPPDTVARAVEHVRRTPEARPDEPDDNAVLDSVCQFDAYAGLVAFGAGLPVEAGFARYWAARSRPAFRTVVTDPAARRALFPGADDRLAAALRALDEAASSEATVVGGWPGIGDADVEAFLAREPG